MNKLLNAGGPESLLESAYYSSEIEYPSHIHDIFPWLAADFRFGATTQPEIPPAIRSRYIESSSGHDG